MEAKRIYGTEKGKPGERHGKGYRFFTHQGVKVPMAFRVEFDADADEGMATVSAYYALGGCPVYDHATGTAAVVAFRTWVRAIPPGEPDPAPTPDAVLWQSSGAVERLERDPLPDEALAELNKAGAA